MDWAVQPCGLWLKRTVTNLQVQDAGGFEDDAESVKQEKGQATFRMVRGRKSDMSQGIVQTVWQSA